MDLAYLLRRSGLPVELTTITLGANPDYATEMFYRENMEEDGSRVERLFRVSERRLLAKLPKRIYLHKWDVCNAD